jgi:hypothetical protein
MPTITINIADIKTPMLDDEIGKPGISLAADFIFTLNIANH